MLNLGIAKGEIPGAVLLIERQGKIAHFEAMGSLDPEQKTPHEAGPPQSTTGS